MRCKADKMSIKMQSYPKVSIIVLNWNGKDDTIECLESLKHIIYPNYEIILVDNGSKDGSVEIFKELYPRIQIIENGVNLGFAEGNNVALKETVTKESDYCLLLNNDTIVDSNFLQELVEISESDETIGIVGPTVFHYNNREKIQSAGGKIHWKRGIAPPYTYVDNRKYVNEARDVDHIVGCALLAKTKLIREIGYLKKNYFAYFEDTEWCVRASKAGYRIVCVPSSKIWHKSGSTSKKTTGFFEYHITRNRFWFMQEHATKKQYIIFLVYFFGLKIWISTAILIYRKNIGGLKSFGKGIIDGITTHY